MGFPLAPSYPVLVVALRPLFRYTQAGAMPPVHAGQPFWVSSHGVAALISGGLARPWQPGDPPAPAQTQLPYTVGGQPGLATGVSNASY